LYAHEGLRLGINDRKGEFFRFKRALGTDDTRVTKNGPLSFPRP